MNFWQEYNYNAEKEMPVAGLEPATILLLPATNSILSVGNIVLILFYVT